MMKAINPIQYADYLFFIEIRQNFFEADIQEVVLAGYFDKPLRKELLQDAGVMIKLKKQHITFGGWKR